MRLKQTKSWNHFWFSWPADWLMFMRRNPAKFSGVVLHHLSDDNTFLSCPQWMPHEVSSDKLYLRYWNSISLIRHLLSLETYRWPAYEGSQLRETSGVGGLLCFSRATHLINTSLTHVPNSENHKGLWHCDDHMTLLTCYSSHKCFSMFSLLFGA